MTRSIPPSLIAAVEMALRLKARMMAEGTTECTDECPRCGQTLRAALVGKKRHLRLACPTENCIQVIE